MRECPSPKQGNLLSKREDHYESASSSCDQKFKTRLHKTEVYFSHLKKKIRRIWLSSPVLIRWLFNYQGPRYPSWYPCHYGPKWLLELQPSHSIPWSFTKEKTKKEKPFLFKDTFQRSRTTSIAYMSLAKNKLQSQPTTRKARKCDPLAGRLENLCFIIERRWGYPGRQLCRRLEGNPWMNSPPKRWN